MTVELPDEILDVILKKCSAQTIALASCISKTWREAGRRASLNVLITPATCDTIIAWLAKDNRAARVTKLSLRRLHLTPHTPRAWRWAGPPGCDDVYANLQDLSVKFCRVWTPLMYIGCLARLETIHLGRIKRYGNTDSTFRTSGLPRSLKAATLLFDDSWRTVSIEDVPDALVSLKIAAPYGIGLRTPEIVVHSFGHLKKLYLETPGYLTNTCRDEMPHLERLHIGFSNEDASVLRTFGRGALLRTLVVVTTCDVTWSRDMAHFASHIAILDADFVALDIVPSPMPAHLEIWADRLATVPMPRDADVRAFVRLDEVPRTFFN